jgi:hypothetical protein
MAKRRKTRREKILSDARAKKIFSKQNDNLLETGRAETFTYSFQPTNTNSFSASTIQTTSSSTYPFLIKDLLRTAIVTGIVLVFELVLFLAQK